MSRRLPIVDARTMEKTSSTVQWLYGLAATGSHCSFSSPNSLARAAACVRLRTPSLP